MREIPMQQVQDENWGLDAKEKKVDSAVPEEVALSVLP